MKILIVVDREKDWPLHIPNVEVVSAKKYLCDLRYNELKRTRLFNLCKSSRYQSVGYYVSLLGEARGHRPKPDITALQDLKLKSVVKVLSEDFDNLLQSHLKELKSDTFTLSIYFGRNLAKRYDRLCKQLFNQFQFPLLRVEFSHEKRWLIRSINTIALSDVPKSHLDFLMEAASDYFTHQKSSTYRRQQYRYDLAILVNDEEKEKPSNALAIKRFAKAAEKLGMSATLIGKNDYASLAEYDALFIRETTSVTHHTYRFARRAVAEGLVVMDDPVSIVRCTNKVYLAELLAKYKMPTPKTLIIHKDNIREVIPTLGLPVVLKQPDSSFSQGVTKVDNEHDLHTHINKLLQNSELIVAQAFTRTDYDWRIGICDRQPLFACKYYMARSHWQIVKRSADGKKSFEGDAETFDIQQVPKVVLNTALKAANLIGDGLYGVDIKFDGKKCYVIEVNDNPSIDAGVEDAVLKNRLYETIMSIFLKRIEQSKAFKGTQYDASTIAV